MRAPGIAAFFVLLASASVARAEDASTPELPQWGKGIFELRDPHVLAQIRQTPMARSPRTLAPFELEVGTRYTWENDFSFLSDDRTPQNVVVHRVTVDAETRTIDLVARMGVAPRVEVGLEWRAIEWRGGGGLDGLIDAYHVAVGLGHLDRDKRHKNAYLVEGTDSGGRQVSLPGQLTGMGDLRAAARVLALEGGEYWPAASIGFELFIPIANRHLDHARRISESVSLDLSKRLLDLPIVFYAGFAFTHDEFSRVDGINLVNGRVMFYVGLEWEIATTVSLVLHYWQETQRERSLWRHTDLPYFNAVQYIAFGLKLEPLPGLRIELGAVENVLDPNTTGDFGFLANVFFDLDLRRVAEAPETR